VEEIEPAEGRGVLGQRALTPCQNDIPAALPVIKRKGREIWDKVVWPYNSPNYIRPKESGFGGAFDQRRKIWGGR